jgi:Na+/melibiose symporter-like transporter
VQRPGLGTILAGVFKDTLEAMQNRSFTWLAGATLSSQVMTGLQAALALYMANFFWELDDQSKMYLLLSMPVGFLIGMTATRRIHERFDKRMTLIVGPCVLFFFTVLPIVLRLMELFPANGSALLTPLLVACGVAAGLGGVQAVISASSMMADTVDEHELQTGRRQEGIFFGAISFAGKAAIGLGTMMGGLTLDLIQFPVNAVPGEVDPDIVFNLGAVYGPLIGVFVVFAVYCLTHYRLTKAQHEEIIAELARRRAAGNYNDSNP